MSLYPLDEWGVVNGGHTAPVKRDDALLKG